MISASILDQVPYYCFEGLGLARADPSDGAIMYFHWCNRQFAQILGRTEDEVVGRRGTILIGENMDQAHHLYIIERLMTWSQFSLETTSNKKDGTAFSLDMSWAPLSDTETGERWWLCSIRPRDDVEKLSPEGRSHGIPEHDDPMPDSLAENRRLRRENRRLQQLSETVTKVSTKDPLTGLPNRRHFETMLWSWLTRAERSGEDFASICVDLDHFKLVNDNFGHQVGDQVLVKAADRLRQVCRGEGIVARIGGDEFVVLSQLTSSALSISGIADDIIASFSEPLILNGQAFPISTSVGISLASSANWDPDEILSQTDAALYASKENGRGTWSFYTPSMHAKARDDKRLAADLLAACDRDEFFPLFQPIVDANTGQISSAEVLLRWQHPLLGVLRPATFLDMAKKMGVIGRLDKLLFERLRVQLVETDFFDLGLLRVSLNVSSSRLCDPSFLHSILSSGIAPDRFTIEILESDYLDRPSPAFRRVINRLQSRGVSIAVDDFGTGHASLQGLLQIQPDLMKLDQQFITPLLESPRYKKLASSIIGIGKELGIAIVAEGVETRDHALAARNLGCDYLQGYHFGEPMSGERLAKSLMQHQNRTSTPEKSQRRHSGL